MGILYLLCVALMFSFVGSMVKLISPYFSSEYISLFRFVFGVFFLLVLKTLKRQRFSRDLGTQVRKNLGWLIFGGVTKSLAYLTENYGLTHGVSYGNILTSPAQVVFITVISALLLKEHLTRRKLCLLVPCVVGVLLVSWNGRALSDYLSGNLGITCFFLISGCFAGCHVLAQKKVADMDILESNLVMFGFSAIVTVIPTLPKTFGGALAGIQPDWPCLLSCLGVGFVTGIGFYLNAKAIPLVPFYMVPVIQSAMAIFALIWSVLFFHETMTVYTVAGTLMFIGGIIGIQLPEKGVKI